MIRAGVLGTALAGAAIAVGNVLLLALGVMMVLCGKLRS